MELSKTKEIIISFIKTFVATFITIFGTLLLQVPTDVLANPDTWKSGAIAGLLVAIVRSALSETWKKTAPISLGGKKKS